MALTSLTRSIHASMLGVPMPLTASSIAAATAVHAHKSPPAPPSASSPLDATANAGPTQLPRYLSGRGGFIRDRWSTGNSKQHVLVPSPPVALARW
uniref:Uncharacterized protein n=1 Tax=Arundo donax TaxID=35708 RepID=A0A0A9BTR6_ARUDO